MPDFKKLRRKQEKGRRRPVSPWSLPIQQHFVVARTAAAGIVVVWVSSIEISARRHCVDRAANVPMDRSRICAGRRWVGASSSPVAASIILSEGWRTNRCRDDDNSNKPFHGDTPYSFMMATAVMTVAQQRGHDKREHRETCDLFRPKQVALGHRFVNGIVLPPLRPLADNGAPLQNF